jgi:hypothetical protein
MLAGGLQLCSDRRYPPLSPLDTVGARILAHILARILALDWLHGRAANWKDESQISGVQATSLGFCTWSIHFSIFPAAPRPHQD